MSSNIVSVRPLGFLPLLSHSHNPKILVDELIVLNNIQLRIELSVILNQCPNRNEFYLGIFNEIINNNDYDVELTESFLRRMIEVLDGDYSVMNHFHQHQHQLFLNIFVYLDVPTREIITNWISKENPHFFIQHHLNLLLFVSNSRSAVNLKEYEYKIIWESLPIQKQDELILAIQQLNPEVVGSFIENWTQGLRSLKLIEQLVKVNNSKESKSFWQKFLASFLVGDFINNKSRKLLLESILEIKPFLSIIRQIILTLEPSCQIALIFNMKAKEQNVLFSMYSQNSQNPYILSNWLKCLYLNYDNQKDQIELIQDVLNNVPTDKIQIFIEELSLTPSPILAFIPWLFSDEQFKQFAVVINSKVKNQFFKNTLIQTADCSYINSMINQLDDRIEMMYFQMCLFFENDSASLSVFRNQFRQILILKDPVNLDFSCGILVDFPPSLFAYLINFDVFNEFMVEAINYLSEDQLKMLLLFYSKENVPSFFESIAFKLSPRNVDYLLESLPENLKIQCLNHYVNITHASLVDSYNHYAREQNQLCEAYKSFSKVDYKSYENMKETYKKLWLQSCRLEGLLRGMLSVDFRYMDAKYRKIVNPSEQMKSFLAFLDLVNCENNVVHSSNGIISLVQIYQKELNIEDDPKSEISEGYMLQISPDGFKKLNITFIEDLSHFGIHTNSDIELLGINFDNQKIFKEFESDILELMPINMHKLIKQDVSAFFRNIESDNENFKSAMNIYNLIKRFLTNNIDKTLMQKIIDVKKQVLCSSENFQYNLHLDQISNPENAFIMAMLDLKSCHLMARLIAYKNQPNLDDVWKTLNSKGVFSITDLVNRNYVRSTGDLFLLNTNLENQQPKKKMKLLKTQ